MDKNNCSLKRYIINIQECIENIHKYIKNDFYMRMWL